MKRLLGLMLLAGSVLSAQSIESTLLALKDASASRKILSKQLVNEMMALTRRDQSPSEASVQRFSEDLTGALVGKDVTKIRAEALRKAIFDVLSGKGSTFMPASSMRETLASCGIDDRTVQRIVRRFIDIGQEVRGPDDVPVLMKK
jgi:mannitol-specific phosphotransferase system IIBC component